MRHSQAYLSYMRGVAQRLHKGTATPVERMRYHPAIAAEAIGRRKPVPRIG